MGAVLVRRADGDGGAVLEHLDAMAESEHERHAMLDQQHATRPLRDDVGNDALQLFRLGIVEAAAGLVHQQDFRLHRDGTGDADPALLAERQGIDPAARLVGETELVTPPPSPRSGPWSRDMPVAIAPASTFSSAVSPAKGSTFWKVRTSPHPAALVRFQRQQIDAVQRDAAAIGHLEAGEHVDQRGLAGTVGSDQA